MLSILKLIVIIGLAPAFAADDPDKKANHQHRNNKNDNDLVKQTNLLFIMCDDLRPELSIYGRSFMHTPNFERLANKSVTFDYAYTHVAVCNPSRDALLTGLRPDTNGNFNFQRSWSPHILLPTQLARSGYNTAQVGKIMHWDGDFKNVWSFSSFENGWYDYQGKEWTWMNSSVMPNKQPIEKFRDYEFTTKAIETLDRLLKSPQYFMLAVGYKLPHLTIDVPHKYFEMYKGKEAQWALTKRERRFPPSVGEVSYRCCGEPDFKFMREEGAMKFNRSVRIGDINQVWTQEMHNEAMMGYAAGVSFVDSQLGRLLDEIDKRRLWNNLTIVFTADHGMMHGEKGIYEKWTLFEEAVRVPLLISHPNSPYMGQHYSLPVEHVDIYATLNELLKAPYNKKDVCQTGTKCLPLSGKSLGPVLLGAPLYEANFNKKGTPVKGVKKAYNASKYGNVMPRMTHDFAISQVLRCAPKDQVDAAAKQQEFAMSNSDSTEQRKPVQTQNRNAFWNDCDLNQKNNPNEVALIGYSMRTSTYRYTAYFYFNKTTERPEVGRLPFDQELYDHRNETLADFTHRETVNLARKAQFIPHLDTLRKKLVSYINKEIHFRIPLTK